MTPNETTGSRGRRVAIIGAGASGISAIKCCLDEGLDPVCFERTTYFGGLWRYEDDPVEGQGSVMKSTVINVSKEMMSYSDFPTPGEFSVFMHNTQVLEYFKMYSKQFDLEKHIVYNTEVAMVTKADQFNKYGQWSVRTRDISSGKERTDIFDYVLVCTGHHAQKHVPTFPGLTEFQGKVLHSHEYRHPKGLENKRAVIIGIGNSGGDIAVELSRCSKQVYLSTRQGTWILNRVSELGLPLDMLATTRFMTFLKDQVSFYLANIFVSWRLNQRIDHGLYSLQPKYGPLHQHPMVNDDMPNRIICGAIKVKTDVKRFTATGVEFVDGTKEDNIDLVILATGYSFGFPFIDKEVIDVKENQINLYQNVFLPDLDRQTLAIIGCAQPFGAVCPIAEIQCRAALKVFKREAFLPSRAEMWEAIRAKHAFNAQRYVSSRRHTIQVEIVPYMDELAELAGCSVQIGHLLRTDPILALKVFFGPFTPYQFRLYGPQSWPGAKAAIHGQWRRTCEPLKTKPVPASESTFWGSVSHFLLTFVCLMFLRWFISLFF